MNINRSAACTVAALILLIVAASSWAASQSQPSTLSPTESQWSGWSAMGAGYVARRREPHSSRIATKNGTASVRQVDTAFDDSLALVSPGPALSSSEGATFRELWFYTTEEGLHSVAIATLIAQSGIRESKIRKLVGQGKLSLSNAGAAVSWHFDEASDAIWFAAARYDSFHTSADAYHLTLNGKAAQPMAVSDGGPPPLDASATPFVDTLYFEQEPDFLFSPGPVAAEPDADYWFWDYLYGGFKDQIEVALWVPDPASDGTAQLRIALRGWTELEPGNEHEVYARLNGVDIGSSIVWDGFESAELLVDVAQSLLDASGNNTLTLHNSYALGTHPGQYLDAVELRYLRQPRAENGSLWLHALANGAQQVDGFDSDQLLLIESPRGEAVLRNDVLIEADGLGGWSASFAAAEGVDYILAQRGSAHLASVLPDLPSSLSRRRNAADYLIIAPREFAATALSMASYRSARFSQVKLAWLDDIYDEFAAGRQEPAAITAFMRRVQDSWQLSPSVVLIVGKGTLDHKNRMGYGDSFVPISMVSTPWAIAASDDRLLDNSSSHGRFAIGRLPITSDEEGVAYVAKLMDHESGSYGSERYQAVLVADNPDNAGDFHGNSERLAEQLLDGAGFAQVTSLFHPRDSVRAELTLSASWETGYVSYDGHGSSGQVGDGKERFITASDANLLQNTTYPVFTALTCASGDYSWPGSRSLAGALVLNPAGGAIVAIAPTGLSLDADAQRLSNALVAGLFGELNTVGDALRDAKAHTAGSIGSFMPYIYAVVGEPAVFAR